MFPKDGLQTTYVVILFSLKIPFSQIKKLKILSLSHIFTSTHGYQLTLTELRLTQVQKRKLPLNGNMKSNSVINMIFIILLETLM